MGQFYFFVKTDFVPFVSNKKFGIRRLTSGLLYAIVILCIAVMHCNAILVSWKRKDV